MSPSLFTHPSLSPRYSCFPDVHDVDRPPLLPCPKEIEEKEETKESPGIAENSSSCFHEHSQSSNTLTAPNVCHSRQDQNVSLVQDNAPALTSMKLEPKDLMATSVETTSQSHHHAGGSNNPAMVAPNSPASLPTSRPSASFLPLSPPSASPFLSRRQNSQANDPIIPRQTIPTSVASRRISDPSVPPGPAGVSLAVSLAGMLSTSINKTEDENDGATLAPQSLLSALSNAHNIERTLTSGLAHSTARFGLKSPCYFHQRFDDAVNIEGVLDEIASDESMSHSRLMQTATGVREVSKQLQRRPIKLAVKNVMIVTKARDNSLVYLTRELAEWLLSTPRYGSDLGVNVYVDAKLRSSKRFNAAGLLKKEPRFEDMLKYWTPDLCWSSPENIDLVLTLGGDGTVLFTSWLFQRIVPPILSFSLGSLGFLTNFEFSRYKEHLNQIMGDVGMRVNLRMRFTCTVYRADRRKGHRHSPAQEGGRFEVVNELVIDRGPSPYVSNLEVYGDDELLTVVQADGCIFSTPTGSTAYSLSAGGSLIHPSIPAILLTPICPHTLSFRPMVLSDTLLLRIAIPRNSRSTAYCSFDGKGRIELRPGDSVTVEASQYPFPTVVSHGGEWFESIHRSLRWNVRGAVQKGWSGRSGSSNGKRKSKQQTQTKSDDEVAEDRYEYSEEDAEEDEDDEEESEEDGEWDIDTDAGTDIGPGSADSGLGPSENGDSLETGTDSPGRKVMNLLN